MARRLRNNHARSLENVKLHDESVSVLHVNAQGLLSSLDELVGYLLLMKKLPSILCLNETFLDPSVGDVDIEGYTLVSRLDRRDGRQCGGIAVYVLHALVNQVTLLCHSPNGFFCTLTEVHIYLARGTVLPAEKLNPSRI